MPVDVPAADVIARLFHYHRGITVTFLQLRNSDTDACSDCVIVADANCDSGD